MTDMTTTTLQARNVDMETMIRLQRAAKMRGWWMAQYLAALVQLHDVCRARADAGDDGLQAELMALGLETVTG